VIFEKRNRNLVRYRLHPRGELSFLVGCFLFLASALSAAESAAGNRRFVIVFPN
jgi:hypothetical protein